MTQEELQQMNDRITRLENLVNEFYRPDSYRFPRPITGFKGKSAAIASPTVISGSFIQAEVASIKTAVDAIRVVLRDDIKTTL